MGQVYQLACRATGRVLYLDKAGRDVPSDDSPCPNGPCGSNPACDYYIGCPYGRPVTATAIRQRAQEAFPERWQNEPRRRLKREAFLGAVAQWVEEQGAEVELFGEHGWWLPQDRPSHVWERYDVFMWEAGPGGAWSAQIVRDWWVGRDLCWHHGLDPELSLGIRWVLEMEPADLRDEIGHLPRMPRIAFDGEAMAEIMDQGGWRCGDGSGDDTP